MLTRLAFAGAAVGAVAATCAWATLSPESQMCGRTILAGRDPAEFALTYDDGPNDPWTERLLDLLARHKARATFFMMGQFVRRRPEIARAVHAAGHLIGNHTMTHPWLVFESARRVREELAGANAALEDALGAPVRFFRPPHGARRPDVLRTAKDLGLMAVQWNAMGYDWRALSAGEIAANLERGVARNRSRGRGSNLLLHDGGHTGMGADRSRSVEATRLILERYPAGAIRYVTVDAWK